MSQMFSRQEMIRRKFVEMMTNVYTILPAIVDVYDNTTQSATLKVAISKKQPFTGDDLNAPILTEVPVMFPFGGDFRMGWNLKKGDNVLVLFSMRGLDEWLETDGSRPTTQTKFRQHNLMDGIALAGILPNKPTIDDSFKDNTHIADENTFIVFNRGSDGLMIQSDKDIYIESENRVSVMCKNADVKATGKVTLETPETHCTGNLQVDGTIDSIGTITSQDDVLAGTISLKGHSHHYSGIDSGGDSYSGVVDKPI